MSSKSESIAVALITQGHRRFFVGSLPSTILAETCFVTSREEDQEAGFQRTLNQTRAQDIANYIDTGFGTIPTSIILSAQREAELTYDSRAKTIRFNLSPKAFKILDGQHRVWGFKLARTSIRVPVVVYSDLDLGDEARLFIDINTKQKPVPKELVLDIQRLARTGATNDKLINEVFDVFHDAPDSPLLGLTSPFKKSANKISRVTFMAAIKPLLSHFEVLNASHLYGVLSPFLTAVKEITFHSDDPVEIGKPTVFRAFMQAFPELLQRAFPKYGNNINADQWLEVLRGVDKLRPSVFTTNLTNSTKAVLDACKPKIRV